MSATFYQRFPIYKDVLLKSIQSCNTQDQLLVCFEWLELFESRFKNEIPEEIYFKNLNELFHEYVIKQTAIA